MMLLLLLLMMMMMIMTTMNDEEVVFSLTRERVEHGEQTLDALAHQAEH